MEEIRVSLLGQFAVELSDGRRAGPWTRPTAKRLVQVLLLRPGRRAGREELAEILFPDLAPERAANALSKALTMARAALEGKGETSVLAADRTTIAFAAAASCDFADQLHELRAALRMPPGMQRDEALIAALRDERTLLSDELYADWAASARDELEALRRDARLTLARDRSAGHGRSDAEAIVRAWSDAFTHDATCEEAAVGLIRIYSATGRRDLALRTYHRCRAALAEEVGAEPSAELERAHTGALAAPIVESLPVALASPTSHGRDRTVAQLVDGATTARDVLVGGSAGIGKTHVLDVVAAELATRGWRVLRGAAIPADRQVPFAALRSALAGESLLTGDDTLLLSKVLGRSDTTVTELAREQISDAHVERLAEELALALVELSSKRPSLLVLDDVQWMDPALQTVLARVVISPRPRRWSLLLGARTDEPGMAVPFLPSSVERFDLAPLSVSVLRRIVRDHAGQLARPRVEEIVARSRGNPLFAVELARALSSGAARGAIPHRIGDLFRMRLAACSSNARRIAPLVAILGDRPTYDVLVHAGASRAVTGSPERAIRALDELTTARLLVEVESGVSLSHPLLRETLLQDLNGLRIGALCSLVAEVLERDGDPISREAAARQRLAAYEASGLREHAEAAAIAGFESGTHAIEVYALDAGLALLRGGLAAFESAPGATRTRLRSGAVRAWRLVGDILLNRSDARAAHAAYTAALGLAEADDELSEAWRALGEIPYRRGDMPAAVEAYQRGLDAVSPSATTVRARLEADIGWAHLRRNRPEDGLAMLEPAAAALLAGAELRAAARVLDRVSVALLMLEQFERALETNDRAAQVWRCLEPVRAMVGQLVHRGQILAALSRGAEALDAFALAIEEARRQGDPYMESVANWQKAETLTRLGEFEAAIAARDEEIALLRPMANHRNIAGAHLHRARMLLELGRIGESDLAAQAAREAASLDGDPDLIRDVERDLRSGKSGPG